MKSIYIFIVSMSLVGSHCFSMAMHNVDMLKRIMVETLKKRAQEAAKKAAIKAAERAAIEAAKKAAIEAALIKSAKVIGAAALGKAADYALDHISGKTEKEEKEAEERKQQTREIQALRKQNEVLGNQIEKLTDALIKKG